MPPVPSPAVLASLKQALSAHAPFATMEDADVDRLVRASRIKYFATGETVIAPTSERPAHCYVIRQGAIRGMRPGNNGDANALWELGAGEMFPLSALLARRGVTSLYRATKDTFCLAFPAAVFDSLIATSAVFADFCTRRLAFLLDLSRAKLQADYAAAITEQRGLATPLGMLLRRAPVVCGAETPLRDALATMEAENIGSLPVVDGEERPLGIFTRQDVVKRVVLAQRPLEVPIREVMSAPVITLPAAATAGDAAIVMAGSGIRHVVIRGEDGKVAGVVSERDLFILQRLSVRELASALRRAPDVATLAQCAADIRALSHALVAQGVSAGQLTRMISSLNDRLAVRVLELAAPAFDLSGVALSWIGMGSEGRLEQTIATDQDNGIIFAAHDGTAPDAIRERLLPFARQVNDALDRCGYPLCKGGIMAMNPRWCASLDEWTRTFAIWIDRGNPASLLAASIFFDFRTIWGEAGLAEELRADIIRRSRANSRFLKQMADNALRNRPPLSWLGELQAAEVSGVEGIDLKLSGSVPFVDAARIFALANGVAATGTVERLQQASALMGLQEGEIRGACDAFEYVQLLRLRAQHEHAASGARAPDNPNIVPLARLTDLDRRILTEAMREIRKLQERLEVDYPG